MTGSTGRRWNWLRESLSGLILAVEMSKRVALPAWVEWSAATREVPQEVAKPPPGVMKVPVRPPRVKAQAALVMQQREQIWETLVFVSLAPAQPWGLKSQ